MNNILKTVIETEQEDEIVFSKIHSDEKSAKETVNFIKAYIKDRKNNSKHKYFALQLLCDALKWKKNPFLISYTSEKILKRLGKLAEFNSKSSDPERGKLIFGFHTDMNYSNKFYFLLLRTISEWATIFIEEPKYTNLYKNLEKKGVSFNFPIEQNVPLDPTDLRVSHPTFINETKATNEAQYSAADASEFSSVNKFNFTARKDENEIFYDFTEKTEKEKPAAKNGKQNDFLDFFNEYDDKQEKTIELEVKGGEERKVDGRENAKDNAKLENPFFEAKSKAPPTDFWSSLAKNDPSNEGGDFWASIQTKEEPKDIWSNLKTKEKEKKTEDFFNSFADSENKEAIPENMQNTKVHENPFEKKKNMDFFEHSPILEEKKEKLGFPEKDQDNIKFWTSVQTVEREEDKNSDIDLNQFEDFEDVPASEENPENSVEFLHSSLPPQPHIQINPPPPSLQSESNKLQFWENLGVINGLNTKIEKPDTPKNILDNSKNFEEFYKERKASAEKDGSKINLENSRNFEDFNKDRSQQVLDDNSFFNKGKDSQVFGKSVDSAENNENDEKLRNETINNNFQKEIEVKEGENEKKNENLRPEERNINFLFPQNDFFGLETNSNDKKNTNDQEKFQKIFMEEKPIQVDNNFIFDNFGDDNLNTFFSQEKTKNQLGLEFQEKPDKSEDIHEPDSNPFDIYQREKTETEDNKNSLEDVIHNNLWPKIPNSLHDGFVQNQELAIIPETEEDLLFSNNNKKNSDLKEKEKNNKNIKDDIISQNTENFQKNMDINYFEQNMDKNDQKILDSLKEEDDKHLKNASQDIENNQQILDFNFFKQNIEKNDHNTIEKEYNIKNEFNQNIENIKKNDHINEDNEFFDFEDILEKDKIKFENFPMDKIENAERMIGEIRSKLETKNQTFDQKINDIDKNVDTIERKLERIEISQKSFQKFENNYKNIEKSLKTLEISSQEKDKSSSTMLQDMDKLKRELENLSLLRKEFSNLENRSVGYSNTLDSIQLNMNTLKDTNKNIVNKIDELSNDSKNFNLKNNEFVNKINELSDNMVNKNDLENFKKETNEKLSECSKSLKIKDQQLKDLASEQNEIKKICEEINSNKEELLNQVRNLGTKQNGLQNDLLFFKELSTQLEKSYKKTETFLEEFNRRQDEISKNQQNKNDKDVIQPKIEERLAKNDFVTFEQHLLESSTQINVLREVCEGLKIEINKINELKKDENLRKKDKEQKKLEITKNNEKFKILEKEVQIREETESRKRELAENKSKTYGKCEKLGQDIEKLKGYRKNSDKFITQLDPYKQEEEPQKLQENIESLKKKELSIKKEVSFEKNGPPFNYEDELQATLKKDPKNARMNKLDFVSPLRTNPLKDIERFCNESERLTIPEMSRRTANLKSKNPSSPDPYSLLKLYNLSALPVQQLSTKSNNPGFYISKPKFRGKIFYVSRVKMTKLLHSMNKNMNFLKRDFKNLKKCALINRGLLFENFDIAVFLKTHLKKEGGMGFNIVFQAKEGKDLEDFDFKFNENESNLTLRILETSSTQNNGISCELEIFSSPLDCLTPFLLNLSYSIKAHFSNFVLPLPLFLIKNGDFPFFTRENFIIFWKKNIFNLKSSEPLILNKEIMRNNNDFKLILSNNLIVSKEKNNNRIKIGGLANLFGNIRFAVRFVVFSDNVVIIQTVFEGNRTQLFSKIEEEFISELGFLVSE